MRSLIIGCLFGASLLASDLPPYIAKDYTQLISMPGFSEKLLKMHFKLYENYVKNTNQLLKQLSGMEADDRSLEYGALKLRLGWEFNGMRLHELYFSNLGGPGKLSKKSKLFTDLSGQYGTFSDWKKDFIATGTIRGIGWAILYVDQESGKLMNVWVNEHDGGPLATATPLLLMDVFEHAYMPQFGLDKRKYIELFFDNINWKVVEERYTAAIQK